MVWRTGGLRFDLLGLRLRRPDQMGDQHVHVEQLHALDALQHVQLWRGAAVTAASNTRGGVSAGLQFSGHGLVEHSPLHSPRMCCVGI